MKKHILFILILFIISSCKQDEIIPNELVLEGFIEDNRHPVVLLHKSIVFDEKYDSIQELIENKLVMFGKVTIYDESDSIILIGKLDTTYMPPYIYFTAEMKGHAGKTYQIKAEYEGFEVTAKTTIPQKAYIDSISVYRIPNQELVKLQAYITDDPNTENYYALFYRYNGKKQFTNCFMGVFTDQLANKDNLISVPIFKSVSGTDLELNKNNKTSRYFEPWDTIDVKISSLDKASYEFWNSLSTLSVSSTIPFVPIRENIKSNIIGGKGYWCGYGSSIYRLILKRDTIIKFINKH